KATSTDLVNWTLDDEPVFEKRDFPYSSPLRYNHFYMPEVTEIDGVYYMLMLCVNNNRTVSEYTGFYLATSTDLETWTMVTTQHPIVPMAQAPSSTWRNHNIQEPCLVHENGNTHLYYNGFGDDGKYRIGYLTLNEGAWSDVLPDPLLEDDFSDDSIDTNKWTVADVSGH